MEDTKKQIGLDLNISIKSSDKKKVPPLKVMAPLDFKAET